MRKTLVIFILILFTVSVIGCQFLEAPPKSEVEIAEEDIESDISEIDALDEDLDISELDELDALIIELESD